MNSFQRGLDRYLTSEPFDYGLDNFAESIGEELYKRGIGEGILDSDIVNDWIDKLYYKEDMELEKAYDIIERGVKIFLTTLSKNNAKDVILVSSKNNPEWGTFRFNFESEDLLNNDKAHTVGVGVNSRLVFEYSLHHWKIEKLKGA